MFNVISYIALIIATFAITYTFDIRENYTLLYMLLIAPIFDFILFLYMKRNIKVSLNDISDGIEKNVEVLCNVEVENKAKCAVPYVEYELEINKKFHCNDENIFRERLSIGAKSKIIEEYRLLAIHRGIGKISLNKIEVKSFLGLFKSALVFDGMSKNIMIMPALVEVTGIEDLLFATYEQDEFEEKTNNIFMGEPSYEFKEYEAGDPLNRVNWKLSSKKNILMVRKSAIEIKLNKVLILDPVIFESEDYEERADRLIESIIGISKTFFEMDYCVDIVYFKGSRWEKIKFENMETIPIMQDFFATYDFKHVTKFNKRFKGFGETLDKSNDYIIFTNYKDEEVKIFANILEEIGNSVTIVSDDLEKVIEDEYLLRSDYSLERI